MDRKPGHVGRADRKPVVFDASVTLADGERVPITMANISDEGCQVEADRVLPIGALISLELDTATIKARVRWALGYSAGLGFISDELPKTQLTRTGRA